MGVPKVIEFNSRFGDPETQSYMRLLKTDLLDVLEACEMEPSIKLKLNGKTNTPAELFLPAAATQEIRKGKIITGIQEAEKLDTLQSSTPVLSYIRV